MSAPPTERMIDAAIRDIPASCICRWNWKPSEGRYVCIQHHWHHCPWHFRHAANPGRKDKGVAQ